MSNLLALISKLSPDVRKYLYWSVLGTLLIVFSLVLYNARSQSAVQQEDLAKKEKVLDYDEDIFEESLFKKVKQEIDDLNQELDEVKRLLREKKEETRKAVNADIKDESEKIPDEKDLYDQSEHENNTSDTRRIIKEDTVQTSETAEPETVPADGASKEEAHAFNRLTEMKTEFDNTLGEFHDKLRTRRGQSQPEPGTAVSTATVTELPDVKPQTASKPEATGPDGFGIEVYQAKVVAQPGERKKNHSGILLPSGSFMEASLLSGVICSTGNNQPVPMLIRIKDLTVLPNEIKEDLKGCFAIAEGTAALDQDRILTRLLSLSCVTKKGKSIIDEKIKGWVADEDARPGLSGVPIAKFGTHLARVALAKFIGAFGSALGTSTQVTTSNINGTTTQLKDTSADTMLKAGVGAGIVGVTEELEKFYMHLAESTLPVIEVGPTKNITVIVSEQVVLNIKDRNITPKKSKVSKSINSLVNDTGG